MSQEKHLKKCLDITWYHTKAALERGVIIGGKHMDEYMPQIIN